MDNHREEVALSQRGRVRRGMISITALALAGCLSNSEETESSSESGGHTPAGQTSAPSNTEPTSVDESPPAPSTWGSPFAQVEERNATPDEIPLKDISRLWTARSNHYPVRFNKDRVFIINSNVIEGRTHSGEIVFSKEFDSTHGSWVSEEGVVVRVNTDRFVGFDVNGERHFYTSFRPDTRIDNWDVDIEPHPEPGKLTFILYERPKRLGWEEDVRTQVGVANAVAGTIEWSQVFDFNEDDHPELSSSWGSATTNTELVPKTLIDSATETIYVSMILANSHHDGTKFDRVYAFDLNTGDVKWVQEHEAMSVLVVTEVGILASRISDSNMQKVSEWYILDPATGEATSLETVDNPAIPSKESEADYYQPAVQGKTAYVPNGDALVAFDLGTGEVKWEYLTNRTITSRVVVAANGLVYGTSSGIEFVSHDGEKLGSYEIGEVNSISAGSGRIYVYSDGKVIAIGPTPEKTTTATENDG